jgi:preprotein translocase subunit SecD
VLSIDNISQAQYSVIKDALENQVLYTLEEIFVNQRSSWLTAVDPKTGDPLDAKHFEIARVSADQLGNQVASITFNEEGQRIFCNLTEKNVGNQMAIFVGGTLVSAPVIQDKICGGETIINGDFTGQTCYNKD